MKSFGRITIPTDSEFVEGTRVIAARLGSDAVRDCDGTELPANAQEFGKVYNTYFVIRGDNEWAERNPDEMQRVFLLSDRTLAQTDTLDVLLMHGYFEQQVQPDFETTDYWEVIDRTTDEVVTTWTVDAARGVVTISGCVPMHEYTVAFMAKSLWDPVQMYNYLTNNWTCEKQMMYDPAYPKTAEYVRRHMREWCEANPETNVVRFTTFLYQFSLVFDETGREKYVDWFGYTMSVSPRILEEFAAEYGYRLRAEDLVDGGCYNSPFRVPTKRYLDYMDFIERRVTATAKDLVEITHRAGKEAMMFLGDCWIGAEPYGKYFQEIGLDAVVGSVGGGVTVRMLSEIPHIKYSEGRFLPYFFPDTFFEGNEDNAVAELERNWRTARRAIMRKPLDRIGFGGYLELAARFPRFIDRAEAICDEFREIHAAASVAAPYSGVTVAILNAWGVKRSWMSHMVAHELWYQQVYSYQGVLEALSGLAVKVKFISFDDILDRGIDSDIDVIINVGDAGTAFSGGAYWSDPRIVESVRAWIRAGHGFVGVGEPTAAGDGYRHFALADALGVDRERGFTLSEDKYNIEKKPHFLTEDIKTPIDYGEGMKNIYALKGTDVLDITFSERFRRSVNVGEVCLAANAYGDGRCVYIAGLPYSGQNARLLYRSLYWSSHREGEMHRAFSSNYAIECSYYPTTHCYALVNNADTAETTVFYDIDGKPTEITIEPRGVVWK